MCGVRLKDRKRAKYLMLILNETIYQLAFAYSVRWYGHVLRRVDDHVLRRPLDIEVKGQRRNGWLKRTSERSRLRKKV